MELKMSEKNECWSANNEEFNVETLGDLVDGHDELEAGQTVWVADALPPDAGEYVDADSVIELMGERANDDCGESADDFPDVTAEAKKELDDLLKSWARKNCTPRFWHVRNVREYVLTAEDVLQEVDAKK